MRTPAYWSRSWRIRARCRFSFGVGYSATQCMMVRSLSRCSMKLTTLSMSSRRAPAVEATTGLSLRAMRSSSGQSVNEQLATLMISMPCASIRSTDSSSNGVQMVLKPLAFISRTSRSICSGASRVSSKRLTYLTSSRPLKLGG